MDLYFLQPNWNRYIAKRSQFDESIAKQIIRCSSGGMLGWSGIKFDSLLDQSYMVSAAVYGNFYSCIYGVYLAERIL